MRLSLACLFLLFATTSCDAQGYCAATCHCDPEGEDCPEIENRKFTSDISRDKFKEMRLIGQRPRLQCQPYSDVAARTGEKLCPNPTPDDDEVYCAFQYKCVTKGNTIFYKLKDVREDDFDGDDTLVKTHKGRCGVCSSAQDLAAFLDPTLSFRAITECGLPLFALPNYLGSLEDDDSFTSALAAVTECFVKNFGFTDDCAKLWGSNTVNSSPACNIPCLRWLENCIPGPGPNIASDLCPDDCPVNPSSCFSCPPFAGSPPPNPVCLGRLLQPNGNGDGSCELNECLKCDDEISFDVFNFWSGRTRRKSGIITSVQTQPGIYLGLKRPCNSIANIEQKVPSCDE